MTNQLILHGGLLRPSEDKLSNLEAVEVEVLRFPRNKAILIVRGERAGAN